MRLDDLKGHLGLLPRGQTDEPQDARMGKAAGDGELAEVLVERDQDPTFGEGKGEDLLVAGVGRPVSGPRRRRGP